MISKELKLAYPVWCFKKNTFYNLIHDATQCLKVNLDAIDNEFKLYIDSKYSIKEAVLLASTWQLV